MNKKAKREAVLQWHPAFFAGIQIELSEEAEFLQFENEHQLGTKPKEIDVLIIKKNPETRIRKNIGKIFRKYNIIEYKSPDDYLSINDFYKVYGYACFYKSDTTKENNIKADEITITFVCKNYPHKFIRHLQDERKYIVIRVEEGIYYIQGDFIPIQMILTSEVLENNNFWLHNLTNDLKENKTAEKILEEYGKNKENGLYKSVMNIVVRANREIFEEVRDNMCEALLELMEDELDAKEKQGREAGERGKLVEQIGKKLAKGKSVEEIADALEENVDTIKELMKEIVQNS